MKRTPVNMASNGYKWFWLVVPCIFGLMACSSSVSGYNNSSSNKNGPGPNQVWMQNISYNPDSLSVSKGTKVTWTNKDQVDHTVTSGTPGNPSGTFDSGDVAPGKSWSYTFNTTGTFKYYCKIHLDKMEGVVTVH